MLITLPAKVRQADKRLNENEDIDRMEILASLMALSRYNGSDSLVTMETLRYDYKLSSIHFENRVNRTKLVDYLYRADDKSIINWINKEEYKDKNSPIRVTVAKIENEQNYVTLDYAAVQKILKSNLRLDSKSIALYVYVILVSMSGYRDFTKEDYSKEDRQKGYCFPSHYTISKNVKSSTTSVKSALDNLEDLELIKIINNGKYETRTKDGKLISRDRANSYIIKQDRWEEIVKEAAKDIENIDTLGKAAKEKSLEISNHTGDDYNDIYAIATDDEGNPLVF